MIKSHSLFIISTHALREEGDFLALNGHSSNNPFLPTPSARRATYPRSTTGCRPSYFYPRPPRGGRRQGTDGDCEAVLLISTHALREEGDLGIWINWRR